MPMRYVYICSNCGASSGEVDTLPNTWLSIFSNADAPQGSATLYFESWECVKEYAATQPTK